MDTDEQGMFEFLNLRPGDYTLVEDQPAGYTDGRDTLGTVAGIPTGNDAVNDRFSGICLPAPESHAMNYNFGERPLPGSTLGTGQTATIGFWQNKNGQALIKSLNGGGADGTSAVQLGCWLAATFPSLYGDLAQFTNAGVAAFYQLLFKRTGGQDGPVKLDAQVLAVALAVYVTNENLAGTSAAAYGFRVTATGVGAATFDVGAANRAAFGLDATDSTVLTVFDILSATDAQAWNGRLYDTDHNGTIDALERSLRTMANYVYTTINEQGRL